MKNDKIEISFVEPEGSKKILVLVYEINVDKRG